VSDLRIIKRYGSRKLYDARESRYVSLEEIGDWIRAGEEVRVLDNETSEDVTAWTLTQILSEDGKRGRSAVPSALLHDIIRFGGKAVRGGMEHLRTGMDRVLQASLERLGPVSEIREETTRLRERLDELEAALAALDLPPAPEQRSDSSSKAGEEAPDAGEDRDDEK
jgi:polyhydroxyalkanoate synthesis repressor PhaR